MLHARFCRYSLSAAQTSYTKPTFWLSKCRCVPSMAEPCKLACQLHYEPSCSVLRASQTLQCYGSQSML